MLNDLYNHLEKLTKKTDLIKKKEIGFNTSKNNDLYKWWSITFRCSVVNTFGCHLKFWTKVKKLLPSKLLTKKRNNFI